jgi:hypothetical protein
MGHEAQKEQTGGTSNRLNPRRRDGLVAQQIERLSRIRKASAPNFQLRARLFPLGTAASAVEKQM